VVIAATMARAFSPASPPTALMVTSPLSSMLILAPVASWMPRMVLPLGPMTSPILSGLICMVKIRGAYLLRSGRAMGSTLAISFRMCSRPFRAFSSACSMILSSRPSILMSIWIEVMPFSVPATLKSISPRWSSEPRMSVRMATLAPSLMSPIATPAQGAFIGTPASISAREPPQTVAMDDEPLDSRISETTRRV
jgi:hypothetical protein